MLSGRCRSGTSGNKSCATRHKASTRRTRPTPRVAVCVGSSAYGSATRPRDMTASFDILLQTLLSGVLIGLIYALVAVGLTMIFGVMDIVNFAHGEFLMLGMYASFWGFALWALDPMFTLPLTALMLFALGAAIYHVVS